MMTVEMKNQNFIFFAVENLVVLLFFMVRIDKINIEAPKAITPPSLEGMERRTT